MDATKVVPGSVAGLLAFIIGWDWGMVIVWMLLMSMDVATGYAKARRNNDVNSDAMGKGLLKKFNDACAVFGLLLMQFVINGMGITAPIGPALIGAYCLKELISILENTTGGTSGQPNAVQKWINTIGKLINGDNNKESGDKTNEHNQ